MTEKYELSRRKLLAGLGTIGVAGAGAGMGTSALFSDEEEFSNNIVEAGTLDMSVTGEIVAANDEYIQDVADITGNPIEADGDVEMGFKVRDFKPGDWFILCMTVDSVAENPFYLTIHGDTLEEREGASTEPEGNIDSDTTDNGWQSVTNTNAELGEKVLLSYWEQWGGTDRSDLANLDNITNTESNQFYQGARGALANGGDPGEDGVVAGQSSPAVGYTDAREFYYGLDQDPANAASGNDPLGNGFASGDGILVGGASDPVEVGSDDQSELDRRRMSDPDGDGEAELVFYLCVELPEEVGNEIQGDGLRGNLRFNAEQVRNNGDPRSG